VTEHALEQARARFPDELGPLDHGRLCRRISREVAKAREHGRMAVNLPRFAVRPGATRRSSAKHGPTGLAPSARFAWTLDERRVYVVDVAGEIPVVITCWASPAARADTRA
jgi:hypothetical protein